MSHANLHIERTALQNPYLSVPELPMLGRAKGLWQRGANSALPKQQITAIPFLELAALRRGYK